MTIICLLCLFIMLMAIGSFEGKVISIEGHPFKYRLIKVKNAEKKVFKDRLIRLTNAIISKDGDHKGSILKEIRENLPKELHNGKTQVCSAKKFAEIIGYRSGRNIYKLEKQAIFKGKTITKMKQVCKNLLTFIGES